MDIKKVKSLVAQKESHTVEFKKSTAQLHPAFETICTFLNNQGGAVLIGVTDNGEIVGQEISDATKRAIAYEVSKLEPPAQVRVDYVPVKENKFIIAMEVGAGKQAPYVYDGRPYHREQSTTTTTKRMPQQQYDSLIPHRLQLKFSWEQVTAEEYSIKDLNQDLILGIVRKAVEIKRMPEEALRQTLPEVLEALQLVVDDHLKNAAVALFAKELFPTFPQCQLKVARFKGVDRHEFLDSEISYGNVFDLLEKGMMFVKRHLPIAAKIVPGKLERVETPLIPFNAIREALINALCHRDYSRRGGSIALAIYDDRMEISNHGGLLPNVTLEKIKRGFSDLRNPLIAEVFYRCEMIEKWGRGIPEIIKSCKNAHDPEPEFANDESEFKVIFKFPSSLKPPVVVFGEDGKQLGDLTRRQQEIIDILSSSGKELKMKEIKEKLKEPPADRTLRDDLAALRKLGMVGSRGHAHTTAWFLIK